VVADRVVSGIIGALGVYVLAESTTFDLSVVAGPWLVPMIVGILLIVLGAWGVVRPERGTNTWPGCAVCRWLSPRSSSAPTST